MGPLPLMQSQDVDPPPIFQVVAGIQSEDGGGSDLEEGLLLPLGPDPPPGIHAEQRLRGKKSHLPHVVVDEVVLAAPKEAAFEVDPLAPRPGFPGPQGRRRR
jgi:hypothetical protein